jgi:hypothetical protein
VKMLRLMLLAAVPVLLLGPALARANSIVSADLEANCDGFTVTVGAALGTTYDGFLDYQIATVPAGNGPIVRSLPIQGDASSTLVTATETVAFPTPLVGTFSISGNVALRDTTSQMAFNGGVPVELVCNPARPSIRLKKAIAIPPSLDFADANDEASAPTAVAPSDAEYQLVVVNDGNETLVDIVINDATLGLVNVPVGTLAPGEFRELRSGMAGFAALHVEDRCTSAGTFVNVADVAGRGEGSGILVTDEDPALLICTEPPTGGQGCTPGYWKQAHHFDSWTGYAPTDSYAAVFGVTPSFNKTLLGALQQGGGGEKALGRHAVAALLSAANDDVSYAFSVDEVIAIVRTAYATRDFERAHKELAAENELGCPLN